MEKNPDERFWLFLVPSWILSVFFFLIFLENSGWLPKTPGTINDLAYLIVSFVFLVIPFVSRMKIGKLLEFERELKKTREDMYNFKTDMRQMVAVISSASATVSNVTNVDVSTEQASESEEKLQIERGLKERPKTAMELKILNTLWKRQVLKHPELNGYWTFRLNAVAPEFLKFREAGNRLIGEGLISETDIGQFVFTIKGLRYCAKHYKEFPPDIWVRDIPIPHGNLEKLLENIRRLDESAIGG
jgi:hypothetical protein